MVRRFVSMRVSSTRLWASLEGWSPRLFVLAACFLLVGATNSGLAFVFEGYAFEAWGAIVLEFGRIAALLGTAGLTAGVLARHADLGRAARVVTALAVGFVAVLTGWAALSVAGVWGDPAPFVGLPAYLLSVGSFLLVGAAIVRTNAYARRVGWLLLANVAALFVVFFGRLVVPLDLVATVVPAVQVLLYGSVGYTLHASAVPTTETATASQPTP